ncbi:MAG: DUF1330 domain-containing protein [Halobacteriales archaeon]|nr:DUF1330 domain-containing protein [Halobacteriales archaeon]
MAKPAFVLVDVEVTDPEVYKEYRARAAPTVLAHGGRYVVRGGAQDHLEPGWDLHRTVLLEFPSVAAARAWYTSEEYRKVLPLRLTSSRSRLVILEGLDPAAPLPP